MEKVKTLNTDGGVVKWCSCYEKEHGGSSTN
jgi:hypothetical protein